MSDEKHSPGPWRSGRQDMCSYTLAEGEDGGPWKNVYGNAIGKMHLGRPLPVPVARAYGATEEEALANAALIARAPEMADRIAALEAENAKLRAEAAELRYAADHNKDASKRLNEELRRVNVDRVSLRAEVARLQAALTAEQAATKEATRLMAYWQEREGFGTLRCHLADAVGVLEIWASGGSPRIATSALIVSARAALATIQGINRAEKAEAALRDIDRLQHEFIDNESVTDAIAVVCEMGDIARATLATPQSPPGECDHHDDGVHRVIGDVGCECGYLAPAPAGDGPSLGETIEVLSGGEWRTAEVDQLWPECDAFGWRFADDKWPKGGGATSVKKVDYWRRLNPRPGKEG